MGFYEFVHNYVYTHGGESIMPFGQCNVERTVTILKVTTWNVSSSYVSLNIIVVSSQSLKRLKLETKTKKVNHK